MCLLLLFLSFLVWAAVKGLGFSLDHRHRELHNGSCRLRSQFWDSGFGGLKQGRLVHVPQDERGVPEWTIELAASIDWASFGSRYYLGSISYP